MEHGEENTRIFKKKRKSQKSHVICTYRFVASRLDLISSPHSNKQLKPGRSSKGGGTGIGSSLRRRHSRASSVDRRDMFHKYVQGGGELSEDIRPYDSGLTSELHNASQTSPQWVTLEFGGLF